MMNDTFTYDASGNVTRVGHDPVGTIYDHDECYTIDGRNRMVHAYTTPLNQNCSQTAMNTGGTAPFNQNYSLNAIGNLTSGPAGSYTYPTSGVNSVRPHAPSTIGSTTYTYDQLGRRKTSVASGVTTTYEWNVNNNNPVTVDRAGVRLETNVYGPGGQRLIRKAGPTITLYLGGLVEITSLPATGVVTAKRYYTNGGETVAVRSYSDVDVMVSNPQNTTAVTASNYNADWQLQHYLPYGAKRGGDTLNPTERGFLGQTEDDAVSLVYLNNRHYDPATGTFLSVDPLVSKTGFPYMYGDANPVSKSDPGGLCTSFTKDAKGNWTCTFYTPDDGERSVDNQGDGFCNRGLSLCSVDEGELPHDYTFGDHKPDDYKGVPTGVLEFDPGPDPGQWLIDNRRGILQGAGLAAGIICTAASFGTCLAVAGPVAGASIAQSGQDNLVGDDKCVGNFAISVVTNAVPIGAGRAAQALPLALEQAANAVGGSTMMVGSQASVIDTCGFD